ncbi:phage holin family protein [Enterococcus italicus]|uniref:phage holin family protein n=1 Tax=Enterococcus italicus TaxID=246144 RepID=UPI0020736280|nr:phage holin family protein [Enterococcus italicus]
MKIDWKQKLSSRKFWAAITSLVVAVFAIFGVDKLTTEQVIALVAAVGALIAYILSEGYVDANRADTKEEDDEETK